MARKIYKIRRALKMHFAYTTRLILDQDQKLALMQMLEAERLTWNECSKVKFGIKKNSIVELHAAFYRKFRDEHPEIPAQIVVRSINAVLSTYRSIKSCKHKINRPPVRKNLAVRLDNSSYSYKNRVFSLISLGFRKRVKCKPYLYPKLEALIAKYKFCDPLLFVRGGDIWISLTFNIPETLPTQTLVLGVDFGVRVPAATSEGILYIDKKFNKEKRKLRYLKSQLKSKGTHSAKRHLRKLKKKESYKNANFSHHLSKRILDDTKADIIAVENLKSIKVKKTKYKSANRLSQVPLYQLKQFLTYKALLRQKTVIEVCPAYTSQTNSQTGERLGQRKGRRFITTSGEIWDADINAAINIGLRAKHPVSQTKNLTYGQVKVISPTGGKVLSS